MKKEGMSVSEEALYFSAHQTQYNPGKFKMERVGFEQLCSLFISAL
jgi:hypothetical protein